MALLVLWVIALELFMKPECAFARVCNTSAPPLWWIVPPLAVVLGFFVIQWGARNTGRCKRAKAAQAEQQPRIEREKAEAAVAQAQKDHDHYTLEVYGLGV